MENFYMTLKTTHLVINPQTINGEWVDKSQRTRRISGTYLHGLLESGNGYDIFGIVGDMPTCTGIYPAKVLGRHNDDDATFFLWVDGNGYSHGLVVLTRERSAMKYAQEMFDKRSSFL